MVTAKSFSVKLKRFDADNFQDIVVHSRNRKVKVVMKHIGEGRSGDYDVYDTDDMPLIRFTVFRHYKAGESISPYFVDDETPVTKGDMNDGWRCVSDGSQCTGIDARWSKSRIKEFARYILQEVLADVTAQQRCKHLLEACSWLGSGY